MKLTCLFPVIYITFYLFSCVCVFLLYLFSCLLFYIIKDNKMYCELYHLILRQFLIINSVKFYNMK